VNKVNAAMAKMAVATSGWMAAARNLERTGRRQVGPNGPPMNQPGVTDAARWNTTQSGQSRVISLIVQRSASPKDAAVVER